MKISLTGIKPTGTPHIGNYLGAIRPAIDFAKKDYTPFYFIANYHALTTVKNKKDMEDLILKHTATWLSFGVDELGVVLYLQSDIPEIFELNWILSCFTNKGLLDRAHAYKSLIDKKTKNISQGIYSYPVLMAADILAFDTDIVPVGRDQKQHVEIARDIAKNINKNYNEEIFKIPDVYIKEDLATIEGIDGRKMSKSYGNIIPIFEDQEKLKKIIYKIKTDLSSIEDKKDPDTSTIYNLYKHFASNKETEKLREKYINGGMSWKEAKDDLLNILLKYFKPAKEKYHDIINDKIYIKNILEKNKELARERASKTICKVKKAIGSSF